MSMASMIFSFLLYVCPKESLCTEKGELLIRKRYLKTCLEEGDETYLHDLFKAAVQEIMNIGTL